MSRLLVTLGSDGNTDWVQTPDGQKFTLGTVSVAQFVTKLSGGRSRSVLDQFLKAGTAMISVDPDRMWDLLKPVRAVRANGSFMPSPTIEERNPMHDSDFQAIEAALTDAEKLLGTLSQKVATGQVAGIDAVAKEFVTAAGKIKSPNQSKNQTYYGLGEPKVEVAPTAKSAGLRLAYDVLQENSTVAGEILANLEETNGRIDTLVKEGKKFNAAKAKEDLHEVSVKVAGILRDVDLTQSWVHDDLTKLSGRAEQIHGLFFPGKQGG
jgi:hypothetical protein